MTRETNQSSKEKIPDLTLRKETFDFFYLICGYTPNQKISEALASPTFGFFGDKYILKD